MSNKTGGDLTKMVVTVVFGGFVVLFLHLYNVLILKSKRIRLKLVNQGINGPSPSNFLFGNIPEIKKINQELRSVPKAQSNGGYQISHDWPSSVFPHIFQWRKEYGTLSLSLHLYVYYLYIYIYIPISLFINSGCVGNCGDRGPGPIFTYSTGQIQIVCITDAEMVKEVSLNTSLNLGKPSYLSKDRGPLLGRGILSSSGPYWAHQRKIIAPEFYLDKIEDMVNLMAESTMRMIQAWDGKRKHSEEYVNIRIDQDLRSLSADIISRACFGSNYTLGEKIFLKLRNLQEVMSKGSIGIPGLRYVPSKNNREIWRLEREINTMILKVVKERSEATSERDLLQSILEAAKRYGENGNLPVDITPNKFIVDNCKNIYFAGHETTATSASWCLVLLAANPDWQDRARAEVVEICKGRVPDADILRKMKTLRMVIQETLRLYPPVAFMIRETLEDVNFKHIQIPKGINLQITTPILHQNTELWGPDAAEFKPERFAEGSTGACTIPQAYIPFGAGNRICAGQHFAMAELKMILSLILLKFSFKLSPEYKHSPAFRLVIEPGYGVFLRVREV
ncbi:hypothetical protein LguiA_002417 [Lonicera macranthoides]